MTQNTDTIRVSSGGPILDAGTYEAELSRYEMETGQYGPQRKVYFIVGNDEDQVEISAYINEGKEYTPSSKGYKLLAALINEDPWQVVESGRQLPNWKGLVGKKCRVQITEEQRTDGSSFSKVTGFLSLKKPTVKRQALPEDDIADE